MSLPGAQFLKRQRESVQRPQWGSAVAKLSNS